MMRKPVFVCLRPSKERPGRANKLGAPRKQKVRIDALLESLRFEKFSNNFVGVVEVRDSLVRS